MMERTFNPQFTITSEEEGGRSDSQVKEQATYMPAPNQMDVWTGYQGKLRYDTQKARLDIERQGIFLWKKEESELRLKQLRVQYEAFCRLLGDMVYKNSVGDLLYAITAPDGQKIISKRLLNVTGYETKLYVSYTPAMKAVLEISWGKQEQSGVYFAGAETGIDPAVFLNKFKRRGVLFLVSGRTEKKAAEALLAYSFSTASILEIPFTHRWGKDRSGKWHFARRSELTLREVAKYV